MNSIDRQYKELLLQIIHFGVDKKDRTGTGTKSIFGWQIRHNMKEGFPLLTTKKMAWKSIVTELLWFLRGDTNIKFLVDNGCHIWDGDAYKNFTNEGGELTQEEFINKIKTDERWANSWGDLGPIYGKQWRSWDVPKILTIEKGKIENSIGVEWGSWERNPIDQIANLINELKTNPDSRRLLVNAWNVGELEQMVLPPCHYGFQVYTRELSARERTALGSNGSTAIYDSIKDADYMTIDVKEEMHKVCDQKNVPRRAISLMWNQRSVDTFLGLPFNIASYALLLEIIAKEVNMIPEELIGNLGDTHLYLNHIDQAKEQISRTPYELPSIEITERNWYLHEKVKDHLGEKNFEQKILSYRPECFELVNYQSHPSIKAPLSN
jgi:thymidylate synthase